MATICEQQYRKITSWIACRKINRKFPLPSPQCAAENRLHELWRRLSRGCSMNMSDMAGPMLTGYHDFQLVALSIFVAIRASYAALDLAAGRVTASTGRVRLLLLSGGAFALGIGIWPLHYIGMEAMRLSAMCSYSLIIVALSVVLAVAISLVALWIVFFVAWSFCNKFAAQEA